jgi:hypothetical protein
VTPVTGREKASALSLPDNIRHTEQGAEMDHRELEFRRARRDMLLKLAGAGALGAAGLTGVIRAAIAADTEDVLQGVRYSAGAVTINGKLAVRGQTLLPGQTIVTGPASDAVVVIGSHAFYQRENSSFTYETSAAAMTLRYLSGKILSVFGKGRTNLVTKTATIGIRGTGCYIEAEEERTYFCLCYGKAVVSPKNRPQTRKTIKTTHHESPIYIGSDNLMASAPVVNHTDAELVMLENMVNRVPPFYGKTGGYSY